jgi:hypothetical protein
MGKQARHASTTTPLSYPVRRAIHRETMRVAMDGGVCACSAELSYLTKPVQARSIRKPPSRPRRAQPVASRSGVAAWNRAHGVTSPPAPGRRDVVVEFLLVNTEGKILAVLPSPGEVARELARIERGPEATEGCAWCDMTSTRVISSPESFATAAPLPAFLERPRLASRR